MEKVIETKVIKEEPVLTLKSYVWNDFEASDGEEVSIFMDDLREAKMGDVWGASDTGSSGCLRGSHQQYAEVVYKNNNGVCLILRDCRYTNSDSPREVEELSLIWVEFGNQLPEEEETKANSFPPSVIQAVRDFGKSPAPEEEEETEE